MRRDHRSFSEVNHTRKSLSASGTGSCELINHAALLVRVGDCSLLTDPWFGRPIFNEGWSLLHEDHNCSVSTIAPSSIWLSHEHPDHFHPWTLKQVPVDDRNKTTVYFRKTRDHRVKDWLIKNSFPVVECEPGKQYSLGAGMDLTVFPVGIEDSAALIRYGDKTILNLNDCMFQDESRMRRFLRNIRSEIDFVAYLCGYAEGGGSRADNSFRKRLMTEQAERFRWLLDSLPNSQVLGFAAFKYFSHEENFFQNDSISFDFLRKLVQESSRTIVLKPGDRLESSSTVTSLAAIDFWEDKRKSARPTTNIIPARPVDDSTISLLAEKSQERLRQIMGLIGVALVRLPKRIGLRPLIFHITDIQKGLVLNPGQRSKPTLSELKDLKHPEDSIRISSDALKYALQDDYGLSTCLINGRFEASEVARVNLYRWAMLGLVGASQQRIGFSFILGNFGKIMGSLKN